MLIESSIEIKRGTHHNAIMHKYRNRFGRFPSDIKGFGKAVIRQDMGKNYCIYVLVLTSEDNDWKKRHTTMPLPYWENYGNRCHS
jgi:hypothetical protein